MTRDEFVALPPSVALGVLLDLFPSIAAKLEAIPAPAIPKRPRYDFSIYRKDGVQWASETDIEGLAFWRKRYQEGVDKGGEYAAKDAKRVKNLDAWIAWRRVEPAAAWAGERGDEQVTAAPPSGRPRVYPRRENGSSSASSAGPASSDNSGGIDESY